MAAGFDPNMILQALRFRLQREDETADRNLRDRLATRELEQRDRSLGLDERRLGESTRQFDVNADLSRSDLGLRRELGTRGLDLEAERNAISNRSVGIEGARVNAALEAQRAQQALIAALTGQANNLPQETRDILGSLPPQDRASMAFGFAPQRQDPLAALLTQQILSKYGGGNMSLDPAAQGELLTDVGAATKALTPQRTGLEEMLMMNFLQGGGAGMFPGAAPAQTGPAGAGAAAPGAPPPQLGPVQVPGAGGQQGADLGAQRQSIMADLQNFQAAGLDPGQAGAALAARYGQGVVAQVAQDPEFQAFAETVYGGGQPQAPQAGPAESPAPGSRPGAGRSFTMPGDPGAAAAPIGPQSSNMPAKQNATKPTAAAGARDFMDAASPNPMLATIVQNALQERLRATLTNAIMRSSRRAPAPLLA